MPRVTHVLALLLALLLPLVLLPVVVAAPTQARGADYVAQARAGTNDVRTAHDRRKFRHSACLQRSAQRQAERMARAGALSHSSDAGLTMRRCGLQAWAENVAQALGDLDGRAVVRQWMRSPGHRANILKRGHRLIGIGAVRRGQYWWVVQVFGRRA